MKKGLSLLAGVALSASLFAQLAPGSTAPNWTFTDLNNNTWDLYTLTAQGKTVFIDVSATWCGPCWNYHNTHALAEIYTKHGPNGTCTNDAMVFFIEGDASTTIADLNGTGSNTQGNWVTGTPYPIIDPGNQTGTFNTNYAISYFPTIYKVCPDNKIYEVGQLSASALEASMGSCYSIVNDGLISAGPSSIVCSGSFAPTVTLKNSGTSVMTSNTITYAYDGGTPATYNWTGSLAAGAQTVVTLPSATFTNGSHTITVSPQADDFDANNCSEYEFTVLSAAGVAAPYTNNISSASFPYANWSVANPDNGITWARATTNGGSLKMDCYNYSSAGAVDDVILEPVDMSTLTSASLQFNVAHKIYSATYTDGLEVLVSSDCGASWTTVWSKSGSTLASVSGNSGNTAFTPTANQWRAECINLSSFVGQNKVFVMFRCTNGYGNNIYVDDINISGSVCPTSVEEVSNVSNLNMFPNPANTAANINFELTDKQEVSFNVYNSVGALVYTENKGTLAAGQQNIILNTEAFANGIYMVELVTGDNKTISRLSVSH